MWYWFLAFVLLVSPGLYAQESPDSPAPPGESIDSEETIATGETISSEFQSSDMESDMGAIPAALPAEEIPTLFPPQNVVAIDVPDDDGQAVSVTWTPPTEGRPTRYILEIAGSDGFFEELTRTTLTEYTVSQLENNELYRFRVVAVYENGQSVSDETPPVAPRDHWMKLDEIPVILAILIYISLLLYFIQAARRGVELFIRRISGLTAVEDAIGRATEMGKPVLYIPGTSSIEDVATLASLNILGEVARRTVHYDVKIICPNKDPIVYTIAREIVKETYASEGRPDAFDPDSVFFLVPDQFAFAAGVDGIMVREKPATIFLMGMFWAESLIMAETGASTGAIQIAGTDAVAQLPFFITACDYTLIGEELYAASAYLGREPMLLGTLKAQDFGKLVFLFIMIVFTLLSLLFGLDAAGWVRVR
ncbi:fibronectin type III domain-containing protein [bacterium]|nr:fibronectin type III domain-containing protein [candidate division CSSED10-310 bacterium]